MSDGNGLARFIGVAVIRQVLIFVFWQLVRRSGRDGTYAMNFISNVDDSTTFILAALSSIFAIVTAIFWMIVGWRAMRAHERIAETLDEKLKDRAS
jgi:uncharacterized membrane protein